jgi:hypothetical protein
MADDADDSWLYGGGPDEGSQHGEKQVEEREVPENNGNILESKTFDSTFDEHNFEVNYCGKFAICK